MRRLIGLIALLVIIFGAAWLVHQGYDRAQIGGDISATAPPTAGEDSSMSADVWDTTPASEPSGDDAAAAMAEEPMPSSMAESEASGESTASDTEMASAESPIGSDSDADMPPFPGAIPSFDIVRVEPTGDAVIAGLAEPQSTVELLDGAEALATAEANERGEWAMALEEPLSPGTHDLAIRTTSPDETVVTLSDQRVAVEVSEGAAEQPLVVLNEANAPSKVMQVPAVPEAGTGPELAAAPMTGSGTVIAEAKPAAALAMAEEPAPSAGGSPEGEMAIAGLEPAETAETVPSAMPDSTEQSPPPDVAEGPSPPEPKVSVAAVEAETNGALYIAGTAVTSGTVRVYLDEELLGEAKPSNSGTWLVETARELAPGEYMVRADQIEDGSGSVIARAEVPFEREIEVAILRPTGESAAPGRAEVAGSVAEPKTVIIKRGDNLWRISRELYGDGIRYSTIYRANTDQIRNPDLIYPGQVFILPSGDTAWQN
jgi:nucleoid-associated protein YgaU